MGARSVVLGIVAACISFPCLAGTYHAGGGCKPLPTHVPAADVAVSAGVGANRQNVLPADVNAPPISHESLTNPPIALNLPLNAYLKPDAYNADLSAAEIQLGTLKADADKGLTLNNETLSTGAESVYSTDCQ